MAFRPTASTARPSILGIGRTDRERETYVAVAERTWRTALRPSLGDVVDAVIGAAVKEVAHAAHAPFPLTAPTLARLAADPSARSARGRSRWRARVHAGLWSDIVGGALLPTASEIARAHVGLLFGRPALTAVDWSRGRITLPVRRDACAFGVVVGYDIEAGSVAVAFENLVTPRSRIPAPTREGLDEALDAAIPQGSEPPANRVLRLLRRSVPVDTIVAEPDEDGIDVVPVRRGRVPGRLLAELTALADREGVELRVSPDAGWLPVEDLAGLGFVWADGREALLMTRRPVTPPGPAAAR